MLIISHRGNLDGPNPEKENTLPYISSAIKKGFIVEVDLWVDDNSKYFLGHDKPEHPVTLEWLEDRSSNLIVHTKNIEAAQMLHGGRLNWFYHTDEDIVLTSKGWIWTYPGVFLRKGIVVQIGEPDINIPVVHGVCTDYPIQFKKLWKEPE